MASQSRTRPAEPQDRQQLQDLFDQETAQMASLQECLTLEQQALWTTDTETLFSLAIRKESLLKNLLALRQRRQGSLNRLAAGRGEDFSPHWLTRMLRRHRQTLTDQMQQIARLNDQNRTYIKDTLDIIDEFMEIAGGGNSRPALYQSKGLISKDKISSRFNCQV